MLELAVAAAVAASPAAQATERLLDAMGGRAAWADVRAMMVEATHHEVRRPAPYANRIDIDFARPRIAFTAEGPGISRRRVVDGDAGAQRRDGVTSALDAAAIAEERTWWAGHIYRTVHRLAARDPALTARLDGEGRLEVIEGGRPLLLLRLNAAGEPVLFSVAATGTATVFGPLTAFPGSGGVRVPAFSVRPDGSWRAVLTAVRVNPDLAAIDFARP